MVMRGRTDCADRSWLEPETLAAAGSNKPAEMAKINAKRHKEPHFLGIILRPTPPQRRTLAHSSPAVNHLVVAATCPRTLP